MARKTWEATLEKANENLKEYGAQLKVRRQLGGDGYSLLVHWSDGETEDYASGFYEEELNQLVSEAWPDVRIKSRHRGDRIIRCIVHVDTTERDGMHSGKFSHEHEYLGSEEAAVRWMNQTLRHALDDAPTMVSSEDLISVNAALAEQYDSPANGAAYASIEDITEEVIVKCSEVFCEHHWSHKALMNVVHELGVDMYDIEKQ
jgi:hypothetical protein